jgi:Uma2 family endonuclease
MIETLVSVEEYLKGDFRPDVDYVDGHIEERHKGEKNHGKLVIRLTNLLNAMAGVFAFAETRVNVRASRYRVPDVCAYLDSEPEEEVFTRPPFLCVEVLSPEDRISRMMQVVKDYFEMGVRDVWIVDPQGEVYLCDAAGGWKIAPREFGTSDTRIVTSYSEIFGA